jgi:hypothetical protein
VFFRKRAYLFDANMGEPNNGQPLSQPDRPKPSRHNANRLTLEKRWGIIYALANNESVESITHKYHTSRHIVLAIREQCLKEIQAARERIKAEIELQYYAVACVAMRKLLRQIEVEYSPLRLVRLCDKLDEMMIRLKAPVQTQNPQPLSIKLAALRRAKRNGLSFPSA